MLRDTPTHFENSIPKATFFFWRQRNTHTLKNPQISPKKETKFIYDAVAKQRDQFKNYLIRNKKFCNLHNILQLYKNVH